MLTVVNSLVQDGWNWVIAKGDYVKKTLWIIALATWGLSACGVTPPPDGKISNTAAPQATLSVAEQAVEICGRNFPGVSRAADALTEIGFAESNERFADGKELDDASGQVRVQLAERPVDRGRKEHVCLISVVGMTPEQSFELALPWAQRYAAITNAEAGQGLSPRAVQAWRSVTPARIVFVAANKANETFIRQAGASVRLIVIK